MLDEKINIIHLQRTDKQGMKWILPENPETRPVDKAQIADLSHFPTFHTSQKMAVNSSPQITYA